MTRVLTRDVLTIAVLGLVCTVSLSACGSSSKRPAANSRASAGIAFSECMRAHGVANFPDPTSGGGGFSIHITQSSGINPASPSFRSARANCVKLLPGGGPGTHASEQDIRQDTEMAQCMREHGVTGFPDPIVTSTPPAVNPGKYSSAEYGNGIFIGIPKSINENSPAFQAAAKDCNFSG
jgi:hypothetical protein